MKTVGALYLIYLGIRMLLGARRSTALDVAENAAATVPHIGRRFGEAFLVSSSNPKTVLFLAALLPRLAIMYLTNAAVILTIHASYGCAARVVQGRIVSARLRERIAQATGLTFVSLGVGLIASRAPS